MVKRYERSEGRNLRGSTTEGCEKQSRKLARNHGFMIIRHPRPSGGAASAVMRALSLLRPSPTFTSQTFVL
jgi:hypothetical protein